MATEKDKDQAVTDAALAAFARTYNEAELVQNPANGDVDPQLSSIAMALTIDIDGAANGALIDVGCGGGALLQRMAERLKASLGWQYVPIEFEEKLDAVSRLARTHKLSPRTYPTTIDEFNTEPLSFAGRKLYVCRNVFHELRIGEAALLIASVCRDFAAEDVFVIQDLLRFPESERHHHAWYLPTFEAALRTVGFAKISSETQASKSGNLWFNLRASDLVRPVPDFAQIRETLLAARVAQWDVWAQVDRPGDNQRKRPGPIDDLDLDLQFASLGRELRDEGLGVNLDPDIQRRLRLKELVRRIELIAGNALPEGALVQAPSHFRERGKQLNVAEEFLRSNDGLAVVHGGPGTGKTTFVDQLLANRLYEKVLVRIDLRSARGFWPVLEQILSQLGVNLAADVMSVLDDLSYQQVQAAFGRVLNAFATRMVFVFENLDEALDSNQRFVDGQVRDLLVQILGKGGIKVILTARREYLPTEIGRAYGNKAPVSVKMARYAGDETVVNVLDDYFDRASAGLESYPHSLITAIDRHPLVAALAGKILAAEGPLVLRDERFFHELQQKLRNDLLARLVDDASRPAVETAGELRVAVPTALLERLVDRESVHHARSNEVLYAVPDRRWHELVQSLGLFKKRNGGDSTPSADDLQHGAEVEHGKIADAYLEFYRLDDNPTWMRESYYHRMLAGGGALLSGAVGAYYRTELLASANYCFERLRDFKNALGLFNAAEQIEPLDESAAMRRASCRIREGEEAAGNEEYTRLVREYPGNIGIRRSHVDALLSIDAFEEARSRLDEYGLKASQNNWHAQQWGRVELGLHHYERAIALFSPLKASKSDDPYVFTYLARALQQFGDLKAAIEVLREGHLLFRDNVSIATSLGANLERDRQDAAAKEILRPLFDANPGNARAALSLVRIYGRDDDLEEAARIVRKCEAAEVRQSMRPFKYRAHIDLLMAQGRPAAAADYIRENLSDDEGPGLLIDALLEASDRAETSLERDGFLREATEVRISERLEHNVPVQVIKAKLAVKLRDQRMFDGAIANLSTTRIDPVELDRLRALFH